VTRSRYKLVTQATRSGTKDSLSTLNNRELASSSTRLFNLHRNLFSLFLTYVSRLTPSLIECSDATFNVQFTISRIPIRRQLQALGGPLPRSLLLFPTLSLQTNAIPEGGDHQFVSKAIESNHAQKEAVLAILNNTSGEAPYVVFGPPGTGMISLIPSSRC